MNRRSFLEMMSVAAAAAPLGSLTAAPQSKRPNIAIILADDLGFSDIGCYGSEIDTPNPNRLAQSGIRFTQFRNTTRCCPSRASLLTGLYSHQAGVGLMVEDRGRPAYQGYLNDRCATLAELLRSVGYRTLMSGNWHVGERELYDLEADRTEMNDLAARMPDKAAQLFKDYNIWAQRCGVAPWDEIRPRRADG